MMARMSMMARTSISVAIVAPAFSLTLGCEARPADGPASPAQVVDSAGVLLVQNPEVGPWGPEPLSVREALRIGVVEGADPYQLARVSDVVMDEEGRIFVGNDMTGTVRVFDGEGRFLREFGGRGQGPGEFTMINALEVTDRGVAVIDWQAGGRTTSFGPGGELLDTWRSTGPDGVRGPTPMHWTPQGWLANHFERDQPDRPTPGEVATTHRHLHRMDDGGEFDEDPVFTLPPSFLYATAEGHGWDWALFEPSRPTAVDESGHLFVSSGRPYQVDVFSPEGELVRSIRRAYEIVPQGPADVDEHLAIVRDYFLGDRFQGTREQGLQQLERYSERVRVQASFPMGDHRAPTRRLLVARDGSFWLERVDHRAPAWLEFERTFPQAMRELLGDEPTLWDLFDADGRFRGQVELPPRFRPHYVDGAAALGVEQDALDVEYVVRYEAVVPDPGSTAALDRGTDPPGPASPLET